MFIKNFKHLKYLKLKNIKRNYLLISLKDISWSLGSTIGGILLVDLFFTEKEIKDTK